MCFSVSPLCYILVTVHLGDCPVITKLPGTTPTAACLSLEVSLTGFRLAFLEFREYHGVCAVEFVNFRSGDIRIHKETVASWDTADRIFQLVSHICCRS